MRLILRVLEGLEQLAKDCRLALPVARMAGPEPSYSAADRKALKALALRGAAHP